MAGHNSFLPHARFLIESLSMTRARPSKKEGIRAALIAPCGMNCRLCRAYMRLTNACPGCRAEDGRKPKTRVLCRIKACEKMKSGRVRSCSGCDDVPCARLKHLDKRYRAKYGMSMIENLEYLKNYGMRSFIRSEKDKWTCSGCGDLLCVHEPRCLRCHSPWR
jgi:hypothetical protein